MKLAALLKSMFLDFIDELKPFINNIKHGSDIEYSTGEFLENIRAQEGVYPGTTEEEQRTLIYLKIAEKHSGGTYPELVDILNTATTGEINEYRKRFDALINPSCEYPAIVADTLRASSASGVQVNAYVNQDLFRLDISQLETDMLGEKL